MRSQRVVRRVARAGGAQRVVVQGGLHLVGDLVVVEGVCVARGVAAGLRQGPGAGRHDGHAARHRLDARQPEALVARTAARSAAPA